MTWREGLENMDALASVQGDVAVLVEFAKLLAVKAKFWKEQGYGDLKSDFDEAMNELWQQAVDKIEGHQSEDK